MAMIFSQIDALNVNRLVRRGNMPSKTGLSRETLVAPNCAPVCCSDGFLTSNRIEQPVILRCDEQPKSAYCEFKAMATVGLKRKDEKQGE